VRPTVKHHRWAKTSKNGQTALLQTRLALAAGSNEFMHTTPQQKRARQKQAAHVKFQSDETCGHQARQAAKVMARPFVCSTFAKWVRDRRQTPCPRCPPQTIAVDLGTRCKEPLSGIVFDGIVQRRKKETGPAGANF